MRFKDDNQTEVIILLYNVSNMTNEQYHIIQYIYNDPNGALYHQIFICPSFTYMYR